MTANALLKDAIQEDMKAAMRAKDSQKLGVIRLLMAAIKQVEIDQRITTTDSDILAVIDKMIKQRRESVKQYQVGNRPELVAQEQFEIDLLQHYLPKPFSDAEIEKLISATIHEVGATSIKDMGKVMAALKPKAQGRADMSKVSAQLKQKLT